MISDKVHPQTIDLVLTRAEPLGIKVEVMKLDEMQLNKKDISGILLQNPDTDGSITNLEHVIKKAKEFGVSFYFEIMFNLFLSFLIKYSKRVYLFAQLIYYLYAC